MRRKGFMKIARQIIQANPGLSAMEIADRAYRRDPTLSNARDPVHSLGATLHKQVHTGMEPGIVVLGERPQRYYPAASSASAAPGTSGQPAYIDQQTGAARPPQISVVVGDERYNGPATKAFVRRMRQLFEELEESTP